MANDSIEKTAGSILVERSVAGAPALSFRPNHCIAEIRGQRSPTPIDFGRRYCEYKLSERRIRGRHGAHWHDAKISSTSIASMRLGQHTVESPGSRKGRAATWPTTDINHQTVALGHRLGPPLSRRGGENGPKISPLEKRLPRGYLLLC